MQKNRQVCTEADWPLHRKKAGESLNSLGRQMSSQTRVFSSRHVSRQVLRQACGRLGSGGGANREALSEID
jgi:hypothetical protein